MGHGYCTGCVGTGYYIVFGYDTSCTEVGKRQHSMEFMGIFIDAGEEQILAEGARYLRIEGAMYVGIGVLFLWYGYFRGINKPYISLILTVISLGTRVALSYALAPHTPLGVTVIWFSIPIGWFLADVTAFFVYALPRSAERRSYSCKK